SGSGSAEPIRSLRRYDGAAHDGVDVTTEEGRARLARLVGLVGAVTGAREDVAPEEVGLGPLVGVDGDVVRHPRILVGELDGVGPARLDGQAGLVEVDVLSRHLDRVLG